MIKKSYKLIAILCLSSLLTGCWDFRDVNRRTLVLGIGLDWVDDKLKFFAEYASIRPSVTPGGAEPSGQGTDVYNLTGIGKDIDEARTAINQKLPLPVHQGAVRVIVYTNKYLQNNSIESYLNKQDQKCI